MPGLSRLWPPRREIASADGIVIVHPNWWECRRAILKGWIDRVLRMEVAYRFVAKDKGEGVPRRLFQRTETAIVFNTAIRRIDRERTVLATRLETLWKKCVFDLCGVKNVQRRTFASRRHQHTGTADAVAAKCGR